MPDKETLDRARRDKRQGKSASTQAGEFVREEMHHIREGKHGARNAKQAIAIGLSKARRSGVELGTPKNASAQTKKAAASEARRARTHAKTSPRRSRAMIATLGPHHPPTLNDDEPLDTRRLVVAALAMVILVLCFTPAPIGEILAPGS